MYNIKYFIHTVLKFSKGIKMNFSQFITSPSIALFISSHNSICVFNIVIMEANVYLFAPLCHVLC